MKISTREEAQVFADRLSALCNDYSAVVKFDSFTGSISIALNKKQQPIHYEALSMPRHGGTKFFTLLLKEGAP